MTPPSCDDSSDSRQFFEWLVGVIDYACTVRRNQRVRPSITQFCWFSYPTHPGHMAQAGLTMGARHIPATARVVGWGTSFYRKLSDESKTQHEQDTISASGILWSMILAMMPTEVTRPVIRVLNDFNIPHLAGRYVRPGKGFCLELGGRRIVFPNVSRSPPEVYLTRGYSA
ncbi:hypothetical protein F5879DRAFT_813539 [Lentinula edodes]|nr:hypothetical protein F5051DRAFT_339640 [Lentinula edodes]KAJ3897758.1 hypothetical protein F5879DRAFT_813539 [Lentinula edodes]